MTLGQGRPWLYSLGLHLLLGAGLLILIVQADRPAPGPVRMHLLAPSPASQAGGRSPQPAPWRPPSASAPPSAPQVPDWRPAVSTPSLAPSGVQAPVSLDELLPRPATAADPAEAEPGPASRWSSPGGEGYQAPPLPPPGLAPPQGARWTLHILVPGAGGLASAIEGLDSGNPELDAWLEAYLRNVSFPASLDGQDHRLRWSLVLQTGRPQ